MRNLALASLAIAAAAPAAGLEGESSYVSAHAAETMVVERTRLKASPGQREQLVEFIVANWFAMDEVAVSQGLFTSYRLLENPSTDGDWDLIVEVGYPNPDGYSDPDVQARFEVIRAQHETVLIDGKTLRDLGQVVGSERLVVRAGSK